MLDAAGTARRRSDGADSQICDIASQYEVSLRLGRGFCDVVPLDDVPPRFAIDDALCHHSLGAAS